MSAPSTTCPGALALAGPPTTGPSVVCGPLALDLDREGQGRHRERVTRVVFASRTDPGVYHGACCGAYTECVIWQAEKRRLELLTRGLDVPLGEDPFADAPWNTGARLT